MRARGGGVRKPQNESGPPEQERWEDLGPIDEIGRPDEVFDSVDADDALRSAASDAVRRSRTIADRGELDPATAARIAETTSSSARATRMRERLIDGFGALERERFGDARRIGNSIVKELSDVAAVHELIGLANYRMGNWRPAAASLDRARSLSDDVTLWPVLMDCLRAMNRRGEVAELWNELKAASPPHDIMAEGRIVAASTLADAGDLKGAVAVMAPAARRPTRVRDHHLRQWYVLADLHDRAGDRSGAIKWFEAVAAGDPHFADVADRLRTLGRGRRR